jgi:hypothetical protein
VAAGAVVGAVGLAGWVGAEATHGWLRVVLGIVSLIALAYAVFTLGLVGAFLVMRWVVDGDGRLAGTVQRAWFVWILVPILVVSWALWGWLAGYDASQWAWTGASLAGGAVVLVLLGLLLGARDLGSSAPPRRAARKRR